MASSPGLKIFNAEGQYIAACKAGEDAACLVAFNGAGSTIRHGHAKSSIVWTEGSETQSAAESYDFVVTTICARIKALFERNHAVRS
jgi:hypothetical protein